MKTMKWMMLCLIVRHTSSHSHTSRVANDNLQLSVHLTACFCTLANCFLLDFCSTFMSVKKNTVCVHVIWKMLAGTSTALIFGFL